jgi:oxygen-independent coproporphyrinogen-3 oxidase
LEGKTEFGQSYLDYLRKQAQKFWTMIAFIENDIKPTKKGKFFDRWDSV